MHTEICGHACDAFVPLRDAFAENFTRRHELGGACCVSVHGEKVVDLWGGIRNESDGEPWEEDTMALVWSVTKGFAAMTLAIAHSRGWLDYDERIAAYWPEFRLRRPGAGGAFGYADPTTGIGYGYITSRMGTTLSGDPRSGTSAQVSSGAAKTVEGSPPRVRKSCNPQGISRPSSAMLRRLDMTRWDGGLRGAGTRLRVIAGTHHPGS